MKKAYFISDLHLGATYREDTHTRERRLVRFIDSIADEAAEIYLLGDILDYWFEYRYVVPRGYVRFFGKIAELSDRGVKITWLIGNHDIWIFDYIPDELGVTVVDGILDTDVLGVRMVMAHGDGIWKRTKSFKIIRSVFRNKLCQRLYAAIHPRWTVPLAYRWSSNSRLKGADGDGLNPVMNEHESDALKLNINMLAKYSETYHAEATNPKPQYFLYGHLHELVDMKLPCGARMLITGDWLNKFSYAVFDGTAMELKQYTD